LVNSGERANFLLLRPSPGNRRQMLGVSRGGAEMRSSSTPLALAPLRGRACDSGCCRKQRKPRTKIRDDLVAATSSILGLQAEARRRANPARCLQGLRHRLQLAPGRLAEPAVLDFL
jgi:hypothetical protein